MGRATPVHIAAWLCAQPVVYTSMQAVGSAALLPTCLPPMRLLTLPFVPP